MLPEHLAVGVIDCSNNLFWILSRVYEYLTSGNEGRSVAFAGFDAPDALQRLGPGFWRVRSGNQTITSGRAIDSNREALFVQAEGNYAATKNG